ncbi:hypothetical protein MtrunA17_Chr8g0361881 [Medicago truncatula]|uniref:Uncharacterized protein n=1 Tax=Medicago truncatula TaxID=3880 RepID=A0A396GKJ8_MEDTR|nr:hypothetical protein MtrunA17_Chr8g0361881 [Medicago truncatula]
MQIGKARRPKIYVVLAKMKNEDSRVLRRHYKGRNFVPKFQDILHIRKHPKRQRNMHFSTQNKLTCAWCTKWGSRRLHHHPHAPGAWC